MKTIRLTILLLIFPLTFYGQSMTGLWTGTLSNDSNTIRRDQSFEIVLTQYKDKVYGYSRMTFFVHDTLYYIVKRVKGTIEGDICEVKDDDIISHNFPRKPDKGVKLISTFRRNQQDSIWRLDGDWKTTETKRHGYYSISGKIALRTETDLEKSKIIPHLEELKLTDDVAVYKESKKMAEPVAATKPPPVKENKKETIIKEEKQPVVANKETRKEEVAKIPARAEPVAEVKPPVKENKKEAPAVEEKPVIVAVQEKVKENKAEPVVAIKQPVTDNRNEKQLPAAVKTEPVIKEEKAVAGVTKEVKKEEQKVPAKQEPAKPEQAVAIKPVEQKKETAAPLVKAETKKPEEVTIAVKEKQQPLTDPPSAKPVIPQAATFVTERKVAVPQTVFFRSDSLELFLYDNGEVDGDTVSVLINSELVLAKQGLKASAIRKTIYVPAGKTDSLTMVLYAENLGKYPPNTGLLVVHDGDDVYQVRFSADLQQNAAVIFRRKLK